ncbi:hypothetical protein GCM10007416_07710 [Kroppenstedtia guangzhouensis]|uniref:Uncharacterized protein n=1 Tax=Kroppenstedtia guangzhouensis TaxID=1274356 RepID=A0ABQ1G4Z9_9BACL|nr:hypothetical protein GCM10007416_07710 [Kroppenstedtia guangzhouensis]
MEPWRSRQIKSILPVNMKEGWDCMSKAEIKLHGMPSVKEVEVNPMDGHKL